jgi:serine/threonine protein kinase
MGGSLKARVASLKTEGLLLSPIEFLNVATCVTSGLAFLHSGGLVYRDLKSGGVLFGGTGTTSVVLDAEFGVVRFLLDQIAALHTRTSPMAGAALDAAYMAPEMLTTEKTSCLPDPPVDIYSLGCVLYECMVGHPPFRGLREIEVCKCLLAGVRPPLPDTIPTPILALIKECWQEDPLARPTARGVLDRLREMDANIRARSDLGKPSAAADLAVIVPNIDLVSGKMRSTAFSYRPVNASTGGGGGGVGGGGGRGSGGGAVAAFDLAAFARGPVQ